MTTLKTNIKNFAKKNDDVRSPLQIGNIMLRLTPEQIIDVCSKWTLTGYRSPNLIEIENLAKQRKPLI